jgi:ribosome assembly protein YihI (activator of Der GTPase)
MKAVFVVEFQPDVWDSLSAAEKQQWVDQVTDRINSEAHVIGIRTDL